MDVGEKEFEELKERCEHLVKELEEIREQREAEAFAASCYRDERNEAIRLKEKSIREYMQPLTDTMPSDFKDQHDNNPEEWSTIAACVIKSKNREIETLSNFLDEMCQEILYETKKVSKTKESFCSAPCD